MAIGIYSKFNKKLLVSEYFIFSTTYEFFKDQTFQRNLRQSQSKEFHVNSYPHNRPIVAWEISNLCVFQHLSTAISSGVAKGGRGAGGAVRSWRHFYGGGTKGYVVGYEPAKAVLK